MELKKVNQHNAAVLQCMRALNRYFSENTAAPQAFRNGLQKAFEVVKDQFIKWDEVNEHA